MQVGAAIYIYSSYLLPRVVVVQKVLMHLGRRTGRIIWPRSDRHFFLPRVVVDLDDPMLYGIMD